MDQLNKSRVGLIDRLVQKVKLPLFFWLSLLIFGLALALISNYLIEQNQKRVVQSAQLSANSLSVFVADYVEKHKQVVKFISYHHHERILQLSQGGGYPYDLDEINSSIRQLFPEGTEFAISNRYGDIVIGSRVESIGHECQALIKKTMQNIPNVPIVPQAHVAPANTHLANHFDVMFPVEGIDNIAGFWVKLSFKPLQRFIESLNLDEYGLIITTQSDPYEILIGVEKQQATVDTAFSFINEQIQLARLEQNVLADVAIDQVAWQVKAIEKDSVFEQFANQVKTTALIIFMLVFVVAVTLMLFVNRLKVERDRIKQTAVHDELFNAGPTVLLERNIDQKMSIIYASPNANSLLGSKEDSLLAQNYLDWVYPDDVSEIRRNLLEAYQQQQVNVEMVYRIATNENGHYKWIYDLTHVIYDAGGKPEFLRGYITSIHAQKTSEKNATDLIQSVPEAIFVTTLSGEIVEANHAAEQLLSCPKKDFNKQLFSSWLDFDSFDKYEHLKKTFLHQTLLLKGSRGLPGNVVLVDAEGRRINVEINFNQIELNGTQLLVQVVRDVTLQMKTQQQLRSAKDEAEALAVARSRFVATISHEIRTPMNGVLGMTDLLFDTPLNPQQSQYLHAIKQSGDLLLNIINEVLDFAKLEEGQVVLVEEELNLKELIEEALHIMSSSAEDKGLQLKFEFDSRLSESFMLDRLRLQQLLLNLIANAIKFTEKGSVLIKVEPLPTASAQLEQIKLKVVDTGIGIERSQQSKLFDSFTQADESTSRKFGGTGLGLAICRQLVNLMQGQIGVNSEIGQGSEFWVELPVVEVVKPSMQSETAVADKQQSLLPLEGKTVLLIEDNEINQNVIESFLQRLGAQVDIAENGLIGLDYWRLNSHKYQLILMDCQMPVMDGYEATHLIRKEEQLLDQQTHIPIVALTANAMQDDREKCLNAGMDDFLTKPIERESFAEMVEKWCH